MRRPAGFVFPSDPALTLVSMETAEHAATRLLHSPIEKETKMPDSFSDPQDRTAPHGDAIADADELAKAAIDAPMFDRETAAELKFDLYRKRVPTLAVQMAGPFRCRTKEGDVLTTESGWLALDADGDPYPIADDVFRETYEPESANDLPGPDPDELPEEPSDENLPFEPVSMDELVAVSERLNAVVLELKARNILPRDWKPSA